MIGQHATFRPPPQPVGEPAGAADSRPASDPHPPVRPGTRKVGLFGARSALRNAEAENRALVHQVERLRSELAELRQMAGRDVGALRRQNVDLTNQVANLRNRDAVAFEREAAEAAARLREVRGDLAAAGEAAAAERRRAHEVAEQMRSAQATASAEAEAVVRSAQRRAADREREIDDRLAERTARLAELDQRIVVTEDLVMLQEAGVYEYRHRLADAVAYKSRLDGLKDRLKTMARGDGAVLSATGWTVNGSERDGQKMIGEVSKLMLRAYNAEADNAVRSMRPHKLASSVDRLAKVRETIARLGRTMNIRISEPYHRLRLEELELTADYLAKQDEEKERVRAERERLRDEETARREFEREKARLTKEQNHWERARTKWQAQGDEAKVAEAQEMLEQLGSAIAGVEEREANIRTGCVYVISNIGSFGENMVKIGMTRRLEPMDRVRELGDASVPFRFDVHALVFSSDAVSLETRLHRDLADRRVNRVNLRREFFHASPAEVLEVLQRTEAADNLLEYTESAVAEEWRTSVSIVDRSPATVAS